jgi:HPt (histidine-containing phosphotransfer) domain-containing protein
MDVQMPVKNGLETIREIREDSKWADLPVVALTGYTAERDRRTCLDAGMNDCLAKPISAADIATVIHRWAHANSPSETTEKKMETPTEKSPRDVLDVEKALDMIGGDMDLLKEILGMFSADVARKLADLQQGLAISDAAMAKRAGHTLKGAASNICAESVRKVACEIEQLAAQGDLKSVAEKMPSLQAELAKLEAAIALL